MFSSDYWKTTVEDQQIALQIFVEKTAKKSGIRKVKSIYPVPVNDKDRYKEVALQIDIESSVYALTKLVHSLGTSNIPIQINDLQVFGETGDPKLVRSQIEIASVWIPN